MMAIQMYSNMIRRPVESSEDDCSLDLGSDGPRLLNLNVYETMNRTNYPIKLPCPAKQRMLQLRSNHSTSALNAQKSPKVASDVSHESDSKICSEYSNDSNTSSDHESSPRYLEAPRKTENHETSVSRMSIDPGASDSADQSDVLKLNENIQISIQDETEETDESFKNYNSLTRYVSFVGFILSTQLLLCCLTCAFFWTSLNVAYDRLLKEGKFIGILFFNRNLYLLLLSGTVFFYITLVRKEWLRRKIPKISVILFTIILLCLSVLMQLYFGRNSVLYLSTGMAGFCLLFISFTTFCCHINCTRPCGFLTNVALFTVILLGVGYFRGEELWNLLLASCISFLIISVFITNIEMIIFYNDNKFNIGPTDYYLGSMQAHFGFLELLLKLIVIPKPSHIDGLLM